MSLIKQLAGETAIYGVGSILPKLLNWVVLTPIFTNFFEDQSDMGIINDLYFYIAFIIVILTYRMETTFFRFGSQKGYLNLSFTIASITVMTLSLVVCSILYFNIPTLASWVNLENPSYLKWPIFILIFDTLMAIPFARLRFENRPIRFAALKVANVVIHLSLVTFFLYLCPAIIEHNWLPIEGWYSSLDPIEYVFISNLCASAVIFSFLLPLYTHLLPKKEAGPLGLEEEELSKETPQSTQFFDWALFKKMIKYATPLVIVGLAGIINQLSGYPLLRNLGGENGGELSGIYSGGARLAVIMTLFTQAFNYAVEPFFFKNTNRKDADHIYAQVAQAYSIVGSLAFLGVMCFMEIAQILIGEGYREGLNVLPILLVAFFFLGLFYNFSAWYKLEDKTHYGGYIAIGGAAITLITSISLIPQYGIYGPAWAALACYSFMVIITYITGRKFRPIPYPLRRMFSYLFLATIGVMIAMVVRSYLSGATFLILGINTLVFIIISITIAFIEKDFLLSIFKKN